MVEFITKDKKVIPINNDKKLTSEQLKSQEKTPTLDSAKANDLKNKNEKIHGETVIGFLNHHAVTMSVEIKDKGRTQQGTDLKTYDNPVTLSMTGSVWNLSRSDITQGGQMQDTLREELDNGNLRLKNVSRDEFRKLLDVWDEWHLNDLNAGTDEQRKVIEAHKNEGKYEKFDKFLDRPRAILKDNKLNPDRGYDYGSSWLYRPIPNSILEFVRSIQNKLRIDN